MRLVSNALLTLLTVPVCGQAEPALAGLDPVALCDGEELQGRADLDVAFGRFRYHFASDTNRKRFLDEPERWSIQWDGGCARMGPLSGRGDPDRWTVHDGRIYIFASDGCREGFLKAPEKFVLAAGVAESAEAAALDEGRRWIERAVAAHGGADAIDSLRTLKLRAESARSGWTQRLALDVTAAGDIRRRSEWDPPEPSRAGSDTTWVVADAAFVVEDGVECPVTSAEARTDLRRFAHREPVTILWARGRPGFAAEHRGAGKLGEIDVVDVRVTADGLATTLHLDPETAAILGLSWRGRPNDGVTRDVTETFTGWKSVAGVLLPASRTVAVDGRPQPALAVDWQSVELVAAADDVRRTAARAAVERAVRDYVEALYQVRPELIERSVHPALEKYGTWRPDGSEEYRTPSAMTFEQLVELAGQWNRNDQQGQDLEYEIELLDVSDVTAAAKLTAKWGIDYMQLIKRGGQWKIIHVLWQSHPPGR